MDNMFKRDIRFRHLEKKVGIFAFAALFGLLAVIVFIGREKDLFTPKITVFFKVESGAGFSEGMPVKLSGFRIGRIKDLSLDDSAKVIVSLEINKKYQKWIKNSSVARLTKEGLIGESLVEITVGKPGSQVIADRQEIPYERMGGIEELANEARPVLDELKSILRYVNNPEGDIKKSLKNIAGLTGELRQTRGNLDSVITELKGTAGALRESAEKTTPVIEHSDKMVENLNEKTGTLLDRLNSTSGELEKTSRKLPQLTDKVEGVLDDAKKITTSLSAEAPRIKEMLSNTEELLEDTKETVKGVKTSWPVNRMVPRNEEMRLVPLDGAGKNK